MFASGSYSRSSLKVCLALVALASASHRLAAQTQASTTQFINNVESQIANVTASLPTVNTMPLIFGGQNIFAYGLTAQNWNPPLEVASVDGLKAAGVQRVEFNPAVTTITVPGDVANLDVMVYHTRQLGLMLAINPEFNVGEFPVTTFADFTAMAMKTYPMLVARYKPDRFVIVHEPTTQTARMGITATPQQWVAFIDAMEPLIKAASPSTLVGAGDCSHCNEDSYFEAFVVIPNCTAATLSSGCTDFVTIDDYSDSTADFEEVEGWAQLAHANDKTVYMEETFAPHDLPPGEALGGFQSSPTGAEGASLVGSADTVFETLDQQWLSFMAQFDMAYGLQSITTFTTQTFFLYVDANAPYDEATNPTYLKEAAVAVGKGQLTATGQAYFKLVQQDGIPMASSLSNASYATLPTVFNPSCGTTGNPCNANSTVAPDMIVSAFGADLANTTIPATAWSTDLGGTMATLVDSSNTSFPVEMDYVSPAQMNYMVPSNAAPGPATLTITSGDKTVTTSIVLVAPVAPGIYTYFANGQGTPAAIAICSGTCSGWTNSLGNGQFWQYVFTSGCTAEPCAAPLTWGPSDSLTIELFGTGFRHAASLSNVTANIGSTSLQVQYAGAQNVYAGLDQVNVLIPQSLNGAGDVSLTVSAQYTDATTNNSYTLTSNAVNLNLQ